MTIIGIDRGTSIAIALIVLGALLLASLAAAAVAFPFLLPLC